MNWLFLIALLVAAYALIAFYIHRENLWPEHITFYGPFMALKTNRVGFFDRFIPFSGFLRIYGTLGVIMVVLVAVLMTVMLLVSIQHIVVQRPPLTQANDPKNILAIPGVNDFIPFTFAVWFGLIVTMVVHEFGHAILCRVEGIRVKSMGILFAAIPIGAFVEPDEEDQEKSKGLRKMRMFGAGITNNILAGVLCFALMIALLGLAVPVNAPLVKSIYVDTPAHMAGVPANSIIKEVNGVPVNNRAEVTAVLDKTKPGDTIPLAVDNKGVIQRYQLTLAAWPEELSNKTSGFMGVGYYDAPLVKEQFGLLTQPVGFLILLAIPIYSIMNPDGWSTWGILSVDSVDAIMWQVPFDGFWFVIQLLFWCGWFNFVVGTFNALPLIPLDGGYILKEGVDRIFDRRGWQQYAGYVVNAVSYAMLFVLLAVVMLPLLINA